VPEFREATLLWGGQCAGGPRWQVRFLESNACSQRAATFVTGYNPQHTRCASASSVVSVRTLIFLIFPKNVAKSWGNAAEGGGAKAHHLTNTKVLRRPSCTTRHSRQMQIAF